MSSHMRQLLTGGAALILALVLWTGTSLAHDAQLARADAGGRSAIIAGAPATPARMGAGMPMTGTMTCPSHGEMCGSAMGHGMNGHGMNGHGMMGQGMMGQGMMGQGMMGHGAMRQGMTGRGMMRGQMMQHGGAANGAGAAASDAAGTGDAGTGDAGAGAAALPATLPESFATALAEADARRGQQLTRAFGCIGCHSLDESLPMTGPTWHDLAQTAAARVPGQDAAAYLYTSIVRPNALVVPGYLPNIMVQNYSQQLGEQELADIVKHLLTLDE